jgi:hypothetical protein
MGMRKMHRIQEVPKKVFCCCSTKAEYKLDKEHIPVRKQDMNESAREGKQISSIRLQDRFVHLFIHLFIHLAALRIEFRALHSLDRHSTT